MANQGTISWPMTRAMATRPNAEAIVDGETRLTYAQWGRRVRGLTGGLRSLGLRTGDVVEPKPLRAGVPQTRRRGFFGRVRDPQACRPSSPRRLACQNCHDRKG
jgi:hypothetical protein